MPGSVHVPGAQLTASVRGEGPPVLLVHGMADRAAGWEEAAVALAVRARVVAYDRRGYGGSSAPEPYERTTVAEQAEDAAALLSSLDAAPAVVAGRELGALVALDLAQRHRALVSAAVVIDPPLLAFSAAATEALGAERLALEEAWRAGGPGAAVRGWLAARGVTGERADHAAEDHAAFFADFAGLASWPTSRRELRALDVPLAILLTPSAPPHLHPGAEALASLAPRATLASGDDEAAAIHRLLADA
jgi:pimeloyl-ACP methyl ester carboxylesterase